MTLEMYKCKHPTLEVYEEDKYRCQTCMQVIFKLGEFERIVYEEDWNKNCDLLLMHHLLRIFYDDLKTIERKVDFIFQKLLKGGVKNEM